MIRTQLYLPDPLYKSLKNKAKKKHMTFASYTRFYLEQAVMDTKEKKTKEKTALQRFPFLKYAGMIKGSPNDSNNDEIDKFLYDF